MGSKKIDSLLKNEWELYDRDYNFQLQIIIGTGCIILLWILFYFLVEFFTAMLHESPSFLIKAVFTSILLSLLVLFILIKRIKLDTDKRNWYFSGVEGKSIHRKAILEMLRDFLIEHEYTHTEESTHKMFDLKITYFDIERVDFRVRLYYMKMGKTPVAEIGIGPESENNKELLEKLRTGISKEFVKRFGDLDEE